MRNWLGKIQPYKMTWWRKLWMRIFGKAIIGVDYASGQDYSTTIEGVYYKGVFYLTQAYREPRHD